MSAPRVLVVDDEPDISTVLRLTLRRGGFEVTTARDGLEALEKLAAGVPDVVLLDVMMPRLDGLETLRRIRANPETAHLPVIMLTARAQVSDRLAGLERGADDYVAKPFDAAEVVLRVRALLKRTVETRLTSPLMGLLGGWSSAEGLAQLGRDLAAAREIQTRLLPAIPERLAGLEAAALLEPSTVVGGDFYDVVPMPEGRIAVVVGDVSGKGISAALLMVMVRTLLREIASSRSDPAEVVAQLNTSLCRDLPPSMFVTLVLVALDTAREGALRVVTAGHPPPLVVRGGEPESLPFGGPLLGVFAGSEFPVTDVELALGDLVVLFTDGIEDPSEGRTDIGVDHVVQIARGWRGGVAALTEAVAADVRARRQTGLRDDLTVLVLRR